MSDACSHFIANSELETMPVCRFIFRMDYPTNFELLDSPGEIMRMLQSAKKDLWQQLGENTTAHQVVASFLAEDKKTYRQINVEPNAIVIELESVQGLPLRSFEEHVEVSTLFDIANSIAQEFEIDAVTRLGFRIFYFTKLADTHQTVLEACKKLASSAVGPLIEETLGPSSDVGMIFTGKAEDHIGYNFNAGPFLPDETPKFIGHVDHTIFKQASEFNFLCDLDLYDTNFSLAKTAPLKWCRSLFDKQNRLISGLEELVRAQTRN